MELSDNNDDIGFPSWIFFKKWEVIAKKNYHFCCFGTRI